MVYVKFLIIEGFFDILRSSINRDLFIRIDRYFVFLGVVDYIIVDGRLSFLVIL